MEELQNMRTKMEQYRVSKDPALQKTMSVPEMRKLLGLKRQKVTGWFTETFLRQKSLAE